MARHRYVIAYDIADPRRLRRVCTLMEDHGWRLQYSVFVCDLSQAELVDLEVAVNQILDLAVDSIVRIDLGSTAAPVPIVTTGRHRGIPSGGANVI